MHKVCKVFSLGSTKALVKYHSRRKPISFYARHCAYLLCTREYELGKVQITDRTFETHFFHTCILRLDCVPNNEELVLGRLAQGRDAAF